MNEATLLLEVGSEALAELSTAEKAAILAKYTEAQVVIAGMRVFDVLRKKFQPNLKMGRMYEELAAKYHFYDKLYNQYAQAVRAGRLGRTDFSDQRSIERYKFVKDSHTLDSGDEDADE